MPSPTDSATTIAALDATLPQAGTWTVQQIDDFVRHLKSVLVTNLPNLNGAVSASHTELNYSVGVTSAIQSQFANKAPLVGNWVRLINTPTISGTPAAVTLVNGSGGVVMDGTYNEYLVVLLALAPGTDGVVLYLRTSTNGGASYDSGVGNYAYSYIDPSTLQTAASATTIAMTTTIGNAAGEHGVFGFIHLYKPSAVAHFLVNWSLSFRRASDGIPITCAGSGVRATAADVDAIQLFFSSGNVSSGDVYFYGRKP